MCNVNSGRYIYPCTSKQAEVNELWSLDLSTYQWVFINTSKWNSDPPPPREQHSASVIDGNVYIFGGKSRLFPLTSDGSISYVHFSDEVYGDLWKLSIERPEPFILTWDPSTAVTNAIPQDTGLEALIDGFTDNNVNKESDGITPRNGKCVDRVTVKVSISSLTLLILFKGCHPTSLHLPIETLYNGTRSDARVSKLLPFRLFQSSYVIRSDRD